MNNIIKSKEVTESKLSKLQVPLKKGNIRGWNELKFDNEHFESTMKLKYKHKIRHKE